MILTASLFGVMFFWAAGMFFMGALRENRMRSAPSEVPPAPSEVPEVSDVPVENSPESSEDDEARLKRESRAALILRLARLFSKIDPEMNYEPYRQLDLTRAEERATAILNAVNSFLIAGYLIGTLRATDPITEVNPHLKKRITGLLYVGLWQQVNHMISDELEKLIDDPVFVKEAFDLYDEINDIPSNAGTEGYFEIYETHT